VGEMGDLKFDTANTIKGLNINIVCGGCEGWKNNIPKLFRPKHTTTTAPTEILGAFRIKNGTSFYIQVIFYITIHNP
jgi:hypothetical protein